MKEGNDPAIERWRDIPGFDGLYQASTAGRIRRILPNGRTMTMFGMMGDMQMRKLHSHLSYIQKTKPVVEYSVDRCSKCGSYFGGAVFRSEPFIVIRWIRRYIFIWRHSVVCGYCQHQGPWKYSRRGAVRAWNEEKYGEYSRIQKIALRLLIGVMCVLTPPFYYKLYLLIFGR